MEKENINNTIEDDLNRRNRNWDKISDMIDDVDTLKIDTDLLETKVSTNEDDIDALLGYVGDLGTLTTDEKSNIVGALNEIDSNTKTHMAESANKHIHSSGENWIRFDDGTQICYVSSRVDDVLELGNGTYGNPYRSASIRFEYPVSFVSPPTVTASCAPTATSYHRGVVPIIHTANAEGCDVQVFRITSSDTDISVTVFVQAIGRWK